jgi:lipopolysaccharide export system protein LptC
MAVLSLRNSILSFLIVLALGLSSWSIFITKQPRLDISAGANLRPDAFMENVSAIIINSQGNPSLKIESPKMVHYPNHDTTAIDTPHITMYRQSPEPWYINSDYAKATQGLDQLFFWSNVIIRHLTDTANPATTMTTATLTVFPDKQIAQTSDNVTLIQPDTTVHGVGMLANLHDGTVQLLSQARGEYVPNRS